jgi:RNA polymerase sigma factor for flagellar operon FliA
MPLTPDQLQRTWVQFKVYKDPESRVGLIDHYSYLVKITAGRLVTSFPGGIDRDDLISAGVIGLIKSVDQYDPSRDVKFETYAIALIRGAILEMLRDEDWVPRSIREKMKAVDRAQQRLEPRLGRPASPAEIAEEAGMAEQDVNDMLFRMGRTNVFSLDDVVGGTGGNGDESVHFVDMLVDEDASIDGEMEGKELRRLLASGVDRLPERERLVVGLYYFEGLTFKEIGKVLGVSESRVYQLHTQAMGRLRTFMIEQGQAQIA